MLTNCATIEAIEGKVYENLAFTWDPETKTARWEESARPSMFALVDIDKTSVDINWREKNGKQDCSKNHSRKEVIQASADGIALRVCSFMNITKNGQDQQSGFESRASRAVISNNFDRQTGKSTAGPTSTRLPTAGRSTTDGTGSMDAE